MWHTFKKHDGEVVVAYSLELKAKLFWMESKERFDGVDIFVADKWVDSIVNVRVCRRAELSLLQHIVHEVGIPAGEICSWSC